MYYNSTLIYLHTILSIKWLKYDIRRWTYISNNIILNKNISAA
jgi:hypothetical protein